MLKTRPLHPLSEPIVRRPAEALDCVVRTKLDTLVIGPIVFEKTSST
jgi:predicted NodU family carbamoyl transferase